MDATERRPFGALLRAYRVAAGLSQEELAERAHLSQRTISDLERGVTTAPYRDTVAQLADALELVASDRAALEDAVRRARASLAMDQEPGRAPVDPLLATKLAIPPVRLTLVPRPRLITRLVAGLQGPLTLLSAPAGSGKTTLLSAWRATSEGQKLPVAWVSLDKGDNDPTRFWRYVLTALDRSVPGAGASALALLRPSAEPSLEAVLTTLLNALSALARDIVLILDDYHVIEAELIHRTLGFLIEHLPPCLHLLLATRADPPLPLARLRGRGDVTELRAADLRFNAEEAAAFLQQIMGLSLSADEVVALEARTEGWIAGLQLAALSLQGRPTEDAATFIAAFTGSHRHVVDYLMDEVLLRQPEVVQSFLAHTCILERLCAPLCAAVIDGDDPSKAESIAANQEMLEALERNNLFLIPLDDERHWYRYHHLFADTLRRLPLVQVTIPDASVLHRRAGVWFEQHGLLHEAIGHTLAAGAHEHAADLIGRAARTLGARGEIQTISTWLRALPETTLRARPQLSVMYAWLLVDMRDPHGAEQYLQYTEEALTSAGTEEARYLRAVIAAGRAIVKVTTGDASLAIPQAQAALDGLDTTDVRARSIAAIALGLAYFSQGAANEAAEAFRHVAVVNRATNYPLFMVLAFVGEACARRAAGALGPARATYEQAMAWSAELSHPPLLVGSLYTGLADILRERNELDVALDRATHGISLATDLGAVRAERWIEWHVCDLLVLARIKQAQGNLGGALTVVHEAQEKLKRFGAISFAAVLAAFEAQLHLAQGDLDSAVQWLRSVEAHEAPLRFGLTPQFFVYAYEHLEIAPIQVLIAQGRASRDPAPVRRALRLLGQLREKTERSDLAWLQIKTLALQALAYDILGELAPALAALEQALALAEPEGYVRVFVDEGRPMAALLRQCHAHGPLPLFVASLLAAFDGQGPGSTAQPSVLAPTSASSPAVAEPLTERELDVLRLLAAGRSNPEIARTLYVEVNTVKTHVKSLYGKLGVHSRVQAVQRAQELGLL
jgi:LuxR family maltose regulon positive regulatory protein